MPYLEHSYTKNCLLFIWNANLAGKPIFYLATLLWKQRPPKWEQKEAIYSELVITRESSAAITVFGSHSKAGRGVGTLYSGGKKNQKNRRLQVCLMEIHKDQPNEKNKGYSFWACYSKRVSYHHLCLTGVGERVGFRCSVIEAVGLGKLQLS